MTHPKKQAFLEHYPKFCQVRETCQAIGMGKTTFYRWLKEDDEFRDKWDELKKEIEQELLERHEQDLRDIAFSSETPKNVRVLAHFFMLKALNPAKYRDNYNTNVRVGNVTIQLMIPEYDDSLALEKGNVIEGEGKELDGHS